MREPRRPAPWLFSLLILPLGIAVGFQAAPLPFLLARAGVSVDRIATILSIVNIPGVIAFLWTPLLDVKLRRRTWLALAAFGAGIVTCTYFPLIGPKRLTPMTALILLSFVMASCVFGACGGLMAKTLTTEAQGKASAWLQAGMQGSGALGGAAIIWLAARSTLRFVGFCTGLVIALPGLLAFAVPEAPPASSHVFRGRLSRIGHEVCELLRSSSRRWSAILLISPIGTGAAMFLLPAIASNYRVGATGVTWINGVGGGVVAALGALAGALIPGDWDTRLIYAAAGVSSALAALVLLTAAVPAIYLAGTALYLLTNGFCQARYTALVVEIVGAKTGDASMLFSILLSMGLIATTYTIWLEGAAYRHFGTQGLLWTEAAGGLVVGVVVFVVFATCGLGLRRSPELAESASDALTP